MAAEVETGNQLSVIKDFEDKATWRSVVKLRPTRLKKVLVLKVTDSLSSLARVKRSQISVREKLKVLIVIWR